MRPRRGFTLIELLVVVSIIALLISILLPSLRKARHQAKMTLDANNERQILAAVSTYASGNGDHLPPPICFNETLGRWSHPTWLIYNLEDHQGSAGGEVWPYLGRYLPSPKIFVCPFQPGVPTQFEADYDESVEGLQGAYFLLWGYEGFEESSGFVGKRMLGDFKRSDLLLSERLMWNDPGGVYNWIANHPFQRADAFVTRYRAIWHRRPVLDQPWPEIPIPMQAGYADGHVEPYTTRQIIEVYTPDYQMLKSYIPARFGRKSPLYSEVNAGGG
jgi:prepilin-type N-terminal cleavage/methylation domain-containing protein